MTDLTPEDLTPEERADLRAVVDVAGELYMLCHEVGMDALSGTKGPWTIVVTKAGVRIIHREYGACHADITKAPA